MKRRKSIFNKNTKIHYKVLIILISFIFLFFNSVISAEKPKKLKKVYISTVKIKEGVPSNLADKVKKIIKLTIFEKYGTDYQVLDDDAIKIMYKQASTIMASGCDDTSCVTQIADGINADEIIYGSISKDGLKLNLYLTNLERRDLSLITKSVIDISFLESQADYFYEEAAKKLMNKNYKINMIASTSYDPETLDISIMKFTSSDETISMILDYLKELVREGDNAYANKEYINAINSYNKVFEKMDSKITEEKRKKLTDFSDGIIKRYVGIYEMFGDSAYKDYKFEDAIGNYKEALSKTQRLSSSMIIAILEKRIVGKITLSEKTGEIYLFNTSKSLLDQAEYYNIRDDNGNASRVLSKARETIEKSNFSNIEITTAYNDLAKVLKKDLIFTERTFGTIKFVYISGGNFNMDFDNVPSAFMVKENGFWIGKYEVTQKEYMEIMGSNPSFFRGNDLPVENVSWNDCMEFCKIFNKKNIVKARLPYESEWKFACRAGTSTKYYWGDNEDGTFCWYSRNSGKRTNPVGKKQPNSLGLYDMIGNVWEWCIDKQGAIEVADEEIESNDRSNLGSSWGSSASDMVSTYKNYSDPDSRFNTRGFRIVIIP